MTREVPPRYFHPVGGPNYKRFPKVPQTYIGFRYDAKVQSVQFVEKVEVVVNLNRINRNWPVGNEPVFLYTLGPPMVPTREVRSGRLWSPDSHYCAIDTLLSARYATVAHAVAETKRRRALMRLDEPRQEAT